VRDEGRLDHARSFQLDVVGARVVEQPRAGADEHRREVEMQLVEQAGAEALLRRRS
jgi:hypothetical protein